MAAHADRLRTVMARSRPRRRRRHRHSRRTVLCFGATAVAVALTGCGYRPRVHLDGGSKGVDEWRIGLPF